MPPLTRAVAGLGLLLAAPALAALCGHPPPLSCVPPRETVVEAAEEHVRLRLGNAADEALTEQAPLHPNGGEWALEQVPVGSLVGADGAHSGPEASSPG